MPSARDILGDDAIDILKKQGLNNVHIHDIGRRIWESKKEETTQKEKQELEASKIRETGSAMDKLKLLSQETFNSDSKVAQVAKGLASNFVRTGEIASAIQIPNVFTELGKLLPESVQSLTTPAQETTTFPKQYSDLGQKLDEKKEETSRKDVTFARKMELEALDQKMQGAKTYGEYATTGIEKMVDVITHPSEWTVQGITEGASAFDSWLSLGMGGIANKVASPFLKVALGTTAAGTENAIINSLGEGARAKGQGKSEDEIARATIQGGAAGFAMGAPLGGVGAAVSMKMNPDGTPMPKEDILDEGTSGVTDLADELSQNPLMQKIKEENEKEYFNIANEEVAAFNATVDKSLKDSIVRHTEIAKTAAKELANNPAMPHSQLKILINSKYVPTDEELMISNFINDGVPLENRFTGWNIVHALERSIQNPIKTPEEFALTLKEGGYIDEAVVALTEAYVQKDVSIAYNFINQKIQTKGAEYVTQKTQSAFASKRNADGGLPIGETNVPRADGLSGDAPQGGISDAVSNQERIDASLDNGERAVPNDGPDTPSTSEGSRLPTGDEPMGGQQASGGDVDVVSELRSDTVVQPKDGDNLGADVNEVLFKKSKDTKSVRGTLVDLPFGLKGVAIVSKDGKSGTIYEHGTASQLSTWGDNTSRKTLEESLADASIKLEKVGEEKLLSKYAEFKESGKVVNETIVEAKSKDAPLKNGVEFKGFNDFATDVVALVGREDVLENGIPVYTRKNTDGEFVVYDKKSGGIINKAKTLKEAKDVGVERINKMGLERFEQITDKALKQRLEFEAKNSEALHVSKEERNTQKQGNAKESDANEGNSDALDGQSGEVATPSKEDTPQNVDLRSREAVELSKAERKKINESVDTILAKKPEEISEADKDVLRKYTGNGGIESGTYGSLSEHYTPYETVRGVYDALERAGVPMQKALEPAVGSGNFVGHKPELDWTTIDIDPKAHAINKILYPNAKHYNTSFESFKGDGFDAIISNVPFIETRGAGAIKNRPDVKALHDFYFVSAVDKVKEGGVVSFVTSRGTMDKSDMKIRKELMEKSDIIGAYRLPEGTFSKNAHTDVGADIIFLQKRAEGVKAEGKQLANNEAFIKSTKTQDGIYLNDYFQKNPEKILGELEVGVNKQFGTKAYVVKGKADYSKMELDYRKEGTEEDLHVKKEDIPTDSNDFWEYADSNGMEVHGLDTPGILMKDGRISVADARVEFSDIDGGAKLFKDITDTKEGAKIEMLSAIAKAGEANDAKLGNELIASYKKEFKVHPYTDKALVRLFHDIGESEKLAELGSYFDKAFSPAQIFDKRTKFEGSGKMDVSVDAPIQTRMMYHENNKGIVDIAKGGAYIKEGDLYNALENGYSLSGKGHVQNDILYYSGNLYEKMKQVEGLMDVYKNDGIVLSKLEKQLLALEEALPPRRSIEEINVRGDEPWILQNGLEIYPLQKVERMINGGEQRVVEWKSPYGEVFDNYLNSKALVSMKKEESITSYRRRLREANEEVQSVLSQIKEKVLGNETLSRRIEEVYNTKFNGYVSPDYKKASYLIRDVLDELPSGLSLRDNQIEWITRAVYEGKSINAHDVGGGKTLSGVVLAKALKEKGAVNKPLFVVPAKVIENWEKEIKRAFPDAKIVNLFNLEKSTRAKKLYELGNNEADYVLISYEGFKELKLPQDVEMRYVDELMSENLKTEDLKGRALALQTEKINKYKAVLKKENMDKRITIDKLGIDAVFADEARAFKNIGVHSKLVNFKLGKPFSLTVDKNTGVVKLDSALAYGFRFKTRYISEKNNGRNVYMLDATPTPNKPMEIFTMLKHLDHKIFDEYGIYSDRDFANRYFEFGAKMNKKGQAENGLVYIKNAYELRSIMDRYVNRISMQEFKDKGIISIPEEKVNTHYLDGSDESEMVFGDVKKRLMEAKGDRDKRKFVMGIFSEGVSASTDPRSYQRGGIREFVDPTPENNKLESVVDKVIARRAENARAGQIIFLDNAGHEQQNPRDLDKDGNMYEATLDKNLHQEIKEKLIASGRFKPEEIAIISGKEITNPATGKEIGGASGQKGAEMKQAVVDAYDKGTVKVIIGTTEGAGEGMNIQKFTTDIYHMDIPWTPAEIIQRNGRGVRFGNENNLVNTHYFFQAGTFDELMYRTITNKRGWNEALWDAKVKDKIEIVDEGSAMPKEEEFMLQMEKDPIKRRALELQIEYSRLEGDFQAVNEEGYFLKSKRDSLNRGIEVTKEELVVNQERLKSDRPNKYLGELLESISKAKDATKKAELQADYDYKIKNAKANIEKMIEVKHKRIKEQEGLLEKTYKDIENNKMDIKEAGEKLSSFEERHMGKDGKVKTELDMEVC